MIPKEVQDILNQELWGNTYQQYTYALLIFLGLLLLFYVFKRQVLHYFSKLAEKTESNLDDIITDVFASISGGFYMFVALFAAITPLNVSDSISKGLLVILIFWATYHIIGAVEIIIRAFSERNLRKNDSRAPVGLFVFMAKLGLWIIALLLILSNLGINITSLVTGLGIGGIAIALAVQNILGDLFSFFAIHFDKPFSVGDYVVVGATSGTVSKIGVRTTRIKALQGEEVVISNKEITSSQVQNYKKLRKRRVSFQIGVIYETPQKKVEKIPGIIEKIITNIEGVSFGRCHLASFGPSSLDFETVYHVDKGDYLAYMDANQVMLYEIKKAFDKEKIEFAYPTQTIHMAK